MARTSKKSPSQERVYGGILHEVRVSERRQRFIEAGIKLFGEHGYHATTVRMIISEAGLTVRYFYESFENTEALLVACYQELLANYRKQLEKVLVKPYTSPEDFIRAGIRCYFKAMKEPSFLRITQIEILGVSPTVDKVYQQAILEFGALMVNGFIAFSGKELPNKAEADVVSICLTGAFSVGAVHWSKSGYKPSLERMVDTMLLIAGGTYDRLAKH